MTWSWNFKNIMAIDKITGERFELRPGLDYFCEKIGEYLIIDNNGESRLVSAEKMNAIFPAEQFDLIELGPAQL